MTEEFGKGVFKLGFGLMRLPQLPDGTIDVEQVKKMVDMFIAAGGTYFDTAYVYNNGESEEAARKALVERYPRDSFTLCTKLHAGARSVVDEESAKQEFYTSLERTGAGYFDYYLLHALTLRNYQKYDEYHLWDFVKELKEKGLVRHYGFSFHATPELLDELLTSHPDVDFVQLQINYADWENPDVQSRRCYEIARRHGKPVTVMEPVKGGALADPPAPVQALLRLADPKASFASWGIRYAASLDGILAVLSGMSNIAQMKDNLSYMKSFRPLDEAEQEVIRKARIAFAAAGSIPCTACHYCTDGCPMGIPIPEIFAARNRQIIFGEEEAGKAAYEAAVAGAGRASDCIGCGQCEGQCPQHLSVIELLQSCAEALEN